MFQVPAACVRHSRKPKQVYTDLEAAMKGPWKENVAAHCDTWPSSGPEIGRGGAVTERHVAPLELGRGLQAVRRGRILQGSVEIGSRAAIRQLSQPVLHS